MQGMSRHAELHRRRLTHETERAEMGVSEDMVRVSVGLEDIEDIVKDFEQATEKTFEAKQ